jgi:hypothetical protein
VGGGGIITDKGHAFFQKIGCDNMEQCKPGGTTGAMSVGR